MTRLIIVVCFLAAFAAGLMVGIDRHSPEPAEISKSGERCKSWLSSELNLTPEQRERMHSIWSEIARRGGREREERRRRLWQERDEAIAQLIRPEDQPAYDQVVEDYREKMRAMEEEWRTSFDSAVEQTRQILTPEQREKYENVIQRHRSGRSRHRGGWRQRGPVSAPSATSPAA